MKAWKTKKGDIVYTATLPVPGGGTALGLALALPGEHAFTLWEEQAQPADEEVELLAEELRLERREAERGHRGQH